MPMRKRKEIQGVLWKKIILAFLFCAITFAYDGFGIYGFYSPSLPIAEHWMEYVDKYPLNEGGIAVEFPGPSSFRWWLEGSYVGFPRAGVLEKGNAMWLGAGIMLHKEIVPTTEVIFGPQAILGRISAKGTYDWKESDSIRHLIDFDGSGMGAGIGINGGLLFSLRERIRTGVMASVIYFGVSAQDVPIYGRDYFNPSAEIDSSFYNYNGEYIALSLRIIFGLNF